MKYSTHKKVLELEKLLRTKDEKFWIDRGIKNVVKQFENALKAPAYNSFLKKELGKIPFVKKMEDFLRLPAPSKAGYLKSFSFPELFAPKTLTALPRVYSMTSGSTGEPFYFPRTEVQDRQYQLTAELYLRTNFQIQKKTTLYIDAFPMGPWIGGVFTYEVITRIARESNYALSIITTGIDTPAIIRTIKSIGSLYDQVIIGSYGPFAKDILDTGVHEGVDWKMYNIKFIFSAEAFPESFRDYVATIAGSKDIFLDTLNHYGTVDLGTMAYETPICILIRRLAEKNPDLYKKIFGDTIKIPTLSQYLPEMFYFESIDGNLYCTSESAIPLVRYNLEDRGGVITFQEMISIFKEFGIDLVREAKLHNIQKTVWKIPFVYVFERSDFSVSYYAFQVYPGPVRKALLESDVQKFVTGKFTMESTFSKDQNPQLVIYIELKKNKDISKQLTKDVEECVHVKLLDTHSEYRETIKHFGPKAKVQVVLLENGNQEYFKVGTKQKWIKK